MLYKTPDNKIVEVNQMYLTRHGYADLNTGLYITTGNMVRFVVKSVDGKYYDFAILVHEYEYTGEMFSFVMDNYTDRNILNNAIYDKSLPITSEKVKVKGFDNLNGLRYSVHSSHLLYYCFQQANYFGITISDSKPTTG